MSLSKDEIINALEDAECYDGFSCPFGMYGQNKEGEWGCFAKQPNGDPTLGKKYPRHLKVCPATCRRKAEAVRI